jgi:radical SAM superfamily enzyme YgiQ (UPF0313 family)
MTITFIQPSVGRKPDGSPYPRTWVMEPLSIATLASLTPAAHQRVFVDDRLEPIPYDRPTDLVCLSVETYTARRAYQIAAGFRRRGVQVVLGGFHPTLLPDEAAVHAAAIVCGEAEPVWAALLDDAASGSLQPRYQAAAPADLAGLAADRTVFAGRPYGPLALVETSRGCHFDCEFCSIAAVSKRTFRTRPVTEVVREIRTLRQRNLFFVDDNLGANPERLRELCEALQPLRRRWIGQVSLHVAADNALLQLMGRSGCIGVLIGIESLAAGNLAAMGKAVNAGGLGYEAALARLRQHGISVYATFVFGYDRDTRQTFEETFRFIQRQKFFFAAINHLVPFPGTALYARLQAEGRLLHRAWWLDPDYRFGDVAFRPATLSAAELAALCLEYRRKVYSLPGVLHRGLDVRANCRTPCKAALYLTQNLLSRREIERRHGLPLGLPGGAD